MAGETWENRGASSGELLGWLAVGGDGELDRGVLGVVSHRDAQGLVSQVLPLFARAKGHAELLPRRGFRDPSPVLLPEHHGVLGGLDVGQDGRCKHGFHPVWDGRVRAADGQGQREAQDASPPHVSPSVHGDASGGPGGRG